MKSTILGFFLGVVAVKAQTTTAPDYPEVGMNCASYPPEYQAACYSSRSEMPSIPTATGEPNNSILGTDGPPGSDCGSLPPQFQEECYRSRHHGPPKTLIGGDCAALPPRFQSACYASREHTRPGWMTSTIYVTSMITISSCAPTITDCPYTKHPLTTATISSYTTICPVETTTHEYTSTAEDCSTATATGTGGGMSTKTCTHERCHPTTTIVPPPCTKEDCQPSNTVVPPPCTKEDCQPSNTVVPPPCTNDYCKPSDTASPTVTYSQVTGAVGKREVGVFGAVAGLVVALL